MEYERMTHRLPNGEVRTNDTKFNSKEDLIKALYRLNELEDKIEDGTLIELPCKVGDTVWVTIPIGVNKHKIKKKTVKRIDICNDDVINVVCDGYIGRIGWLIFLNKEDAEARLNELQGKRSL